MTTSYIDFDILYTDSMKEFVYDNYTYDEAIDRFIISIIVGGSKKFIQRELDKIRPHSQSRSHSKYRNTLYWDACIETQVTLK